MLTPADINNKQFKTTRLKEGYDQEEVDTFLDRVGEDFAFLVAAVQRLEEDNRTLRRNAQSKAEAVTTVLPTAPPSPSAVAEKLLAAAEEAARQHEAEAKAKGDDVVREAGARGARIVEEATEAAERIKSEGLAEKYRRNEELDAKYRQAQSALDTVRIEGDRARKALAAAIASYDKEMTQ